ncbi:uncharacterized protein LOC108915633 [Anoplophora glabripennis]|uniref:uncharacterized protein LOC108915633 n=1 Tax=Anoplophora glabripennis TaxID=217634 RepID=UPI0008759FE9|nr:uncharacterized protein LOC108915633 [Anoplophora glabripennis]
MNGLILVATSLLALSQAATVVPTDSSTINIQQSGKDFSYSIQQSPGADAVDTPHAIHQVPAQIASIDSSTQAQMGSNQDQIQQQHQIQKRLSEKIQTEINKQEKVKVIDYTVPIPENQLQPLPSNNVVYILPYTFGLHYPQQFIRYI